MQFNYVLGVDMSKAKFNFCLLNAQAQLLWEGQVVNQSPSIEQFIEQLQQRIGLEELQSIIICMEYTGIYVKPLIYAWMARQGRISMVPATQVSQYLAGSQGWADKDDALDARRLAEYAIRFSDKLQPYALKDTTLQALQNLQRLRDRLLKVIQLLEVPVQESQAFDSADLSEQLQVHQQATLQAAKQDLVRVDKTIKKLINKDERLKKLFDLICSVVGVGPVTALEIIISTEGFVKFSPHQAKQFARYAGVVPLKHQSGSSVRKRSRTSKRANQRMKALLTLCAQAALRTKGELRQYYQRKRAEGKEHLVALNAMRNKLILRIFAVVRKQTMYQKNLNFSLVEP